MRCSPARRQVPFGTTETILQATPSLLRKYRNFRAPRGARTPFLSAGTTLKKNWFYELVLLTLIVLISVAVWQFYSLAWGESVNGGPTAGRLEPAYHGTPAARTLPR